MGPMKRVSVLILLMIAAAPLPGRKTRAQDTTLKVNVDLVNVQFSVTDRHGRFVPGLRAEDFTVKEDGRRQRIRNFARENELPLTIGILVDTSPSVRSVFREEKTRAARFLESILRPNDLALLIGFDRTVTLFQDFTETTKLLTSAIDDLEIGGGTSLYDAIYLVCNEKLRREAGRKTIILISDGEDTASKMKMSQALVAADQSDAIIYAISNADDGFSFFGGGRAGDSGTLKKFAKETGGVAFFLDKDTRFGEIFDQIAAELRSQYSIGYVSTNTKKDGKFRRIKITVRGKGYKVRARKGYYAAKAPRR